MMALKDLNGRYTFANPRFLELFGLTQEQLIGRNVCELFPNTYAGLVWVKDLEALRYQNKVSAEHVLPTEAGLPRVLTCPRGRAGLRGLYLGLVTRPSAHRMKASWRAASRQALNLPEAPPWPLVMSVCSRIGALPC